VDVLIDHLPEILRGFARTLSLTGVAGVCALIGGTLLAAMRVSPIPVLRLAGAGYVNVVRNTPLTLIFVIVTFGFPPLDIRLSFYVFAVIALAAYTAAFVCEAVRSGVNAVAAGQSEAARALGLRFGPTLRLVVLPQAFRSVLPPLGSILIALLKNTAIAEAFGYTEATGLISDLARDNDTALYWLFAGAALGYLVLALLIAATFRAAERRLAVLR
jgi:glutamate transport system permease protein